MIIVHFCFLAVQGQYMVDWMIKTDRASMVTSYVAPVQTRLQTFDDTPFVWAAASKEMMEVGMMANNDTNATAAINITETSRYGTVKSQVERQEKILRRRESSITTSVHTTCPRKMEIVNRAAHARRTLFGFRSLFLLRLVYSRAETLELEQSTIL